MSKMSTRGEKTFHDGRGLDPSTILWKKHTIIQQLRTLSAQMNDGFRTTSKVLVSKKCLNYTFIMGI